VDQASIRDLDAAIEIEVGKRKVDEVTQPCVRDTNAVTEVKVSEKTVTEES